MSKKELSRDEKIIKEVKERWFKGHKAEIEKHGDITVLKWKKPDTSIYYVRYVFDGNKMYISGDIGEAVFVLTWKATVESFKDLNLDYFLSKMSTCSHGKYEYDGEEAAKRLIEWKEEFLEENEFNYEYEKEDFLENMDNLIDAARNCSNKEEWCWEYVNGEYEDFISEHDNDYFEWIYNIGDAISYHNYAFLIGLQMAAEQLEYEK